MTNRWVNPINNNILRDLQNNVLANGSVQFYAAGTTTPLAVYSDPDLTVSLGSYLDADAYGLIEDFHLASGTQYKAVAYDAIGGASGLGAVKWTRDDTFGTDSAVDSRLDSLESSVDSINVRRNAILNGGMRVPSQTGSVALTSSYLEGGVAAVYGKVANVTAGTLVQTQDDDYQSGYTLHFSGVTTNNAAATVDAQFRIESKDCHQFMNTDGTFQCYVEHDVGSAVNYTVTVSVATALDDFSSVTAILEGDAVSVATGTRTQLTLPVSGLGDVSNGIAITVSAACGTVTTKNFKVGDGQFELGLTATEFSELPYKVVKAGVNSEDAVLTKYDTETISGLRISSHTDADHDIEISVGGTVDSTRTYPLAVTSSIVKKIDLAWAEGVNSGGLPSGLTLSSNTWYRLFLIGKTDGTTNAGFDISETAANIFIDATEYSLYRQIGWVLTDGVANIVAFRQYGDMFFWDAPFEQAAWSLSTSAANLVVGAPPETTAMLSFELSATAGNSIYTVVRHPDAADVAASATSYTFMLRAPGSSDTRSSFRVECPTNGSSQVEVRSSGTAGSAPAVMSLGWIDDRSI